MILCVTLPTINEQKSDVFGFIQSFNNDTKYHAVRFIQVNGTKSWKSWSDFSKDYAIHKKGKKGLLSLTLLKKEYSNRKSLHSLCTHDLTLTEIKDAA